MNCYRVWMKDGYAGLYNAEHESDAMAQAVEVARKTCDGVRMSKADLRRACAVDRVDNLTLQAVMKKVERVAAESREAVQS